MDLFFRRFFAFIIMKDSLLFLKFVNFSMVIRIIIASFYMLKYCLITYRNFSETNLNSMKNIRFTCSKVMKESLSKGRWEIKD